MIGQTKLPPRKSATQADVAKRAGVSRSAVSVVLNGVGTSVRISEETHRRVQQAAADLKYQPNALARGLSRGRMNTLGIVAAGHRGDILLGHYTSNVIQGVIDVATDRLQSTAIFHGNHWSEASEILPAYCDGRNDGLLLLAPSDLLLEAMQDTHIPFVVIGENSQVPGLTSVDIDDPATAHQLTTYLIDRGHRRIAIVGGDSSCFAQRLEGFQKAHQDRGLPYNMDFVISTEWSPETAAESRHALEKLLARPGNERPTAVFGQTDKFAISIIRTIREFGLRVPQDISVVGIDDEPESQSMDLTTIRQNPRQVGVKAAELLLEMIDKKTPPGHKEFLPTEFIIRGSVADVAQI